LIEKAASKWKEIKGDYRDDITAQIGLAMARSIGDHAVKAIGVIADPVVTTHNLIESVEFLIIGTDGV